jgi:hypothetical protein
LIMAKLLAAHTPSLLLLLPASCSLRSFFIISPVCAWGVAGVGGSSSRGEGEHGMWVSGGQYCHHGGCGPQLAGACVDVQGVIQT